MQKDVVNAVFSGFSGVELESVSVFLIYTDDLAAMMLVLKCCEYVFSSIWKGVDSFKLPDFLEISASKMPE